MYYEKEIVIHTEFVDGISWLGLRFFSNVHVSGFLRAYGYGPNAGSWVYAKNCRCNGLGSFTNSPGAGNCKG